MRKGSCAASLGLLIAFFLLPACVGAQAPDDASFVTKDALKAMLGNGEMTLIDLRFGRDWYDSGLKIKGAIREDPMKPGQWIDKYGKDKFLVFY